MLGQKINLLTGIRFPGGWKILILKIWYFKYRGLSLIIAKKLRNIILTIK